MTIKEFEQQLKALFCRQKKIKDIKLMNKDLFSHWVLKRLYQREVSAMENLTDIDIDELLKECITWYYMFGSNASADDLLDYKDKIVISSYRLSQRLSDVSEKYENIVVTNKDLVSKGIQKHAKSESATVAREKSKVSAGRYLKQEAQYKGEIKRIENILSSLDKIINAMTQRIAWIRQEHSRSTQI